jgi:ABC-type lipoprotein export system ATPase subunit
VSEPVLSARGLRKTFASGDANLEVLRGVDLDIAAGESVSIRGESGSGKSTLLHLMAGLESPDAGAVSWAGSADTGARRRSSYLGMVFQSFYLIPELDALANVVLAGRIRGGLDRAARSRARDLLSHVGLSARMHHLPTQLSGGERQRVALARALMNSPRLILADEPTGNLDTKNSDIVLGMLRKLNKDLGQTIIMITHNPEAAAYSDRVVHMRDGIIVDGVPAD